MTDLNKNSTLANNPVSSITPVDNPPKENPSKYDEVLNQYSQSKPEESTPEPEIKTEPESKSNSWAENLPKTESISSEPASREPAESTESIPETPIETPLESIPEPENETFLKPQPEIEITPEPEFLNKTPDQIKQEISQILDDTSVDSTSTIIPPVKSKTNIFQIIFVLSLVIFLIVASTIAYFVFFNKTTSDNSDNSVVETITPTPVSSITCNLNDKTYKVGEGFPSADGCNTCSCTENGSIVCTEKACESTKSATPTVTKSATTSAIPKDWKTYTSTKYGFKLQYPKNLVLSSISKDDNVIFSTESDGYWHYDIKVENNTEKLTLEKAADRLKEKIESNSETEKEILITDITIDNNPSKRFSIKDYGHGNALVILIVNNNIFTISGDDNTTSAKKEFETVFSSLKLN